MASALIKKKSILCIVLIVAVSLLFSACDPYANSHPYLTESTWVCSDPKITLEYTKGRTGMMTELCTIEWNDMSLEFDLYFRSTLFEAGPAGYTKYEDRLFSGTWKYRDGNLVLMLDEDFLFDNAYKELVFVKVNTTEDDSLP